MRSGSRPRGSPWHVEAATLPATIRPATIWPRNYPTPQLSGPYRFRRERDVGEDFRDVRIVVAVAVPGPAHAGSSTSPWRPIFSKREQSMRQTSPSAGGSARPSATCAEPLPGKGELHGPSAIGVVAAVDHSIHMRPRSAGPGSPSRGSPIARRAGGRGRPRHRAPGCAAWPGRTPAGRSRASRASGCPSRSRRPRRRY